MKKIFLLCSFLIATCLFTPMNVSASDLTGTYKYESDLVAGSVTLKALGNGSYDVALNLFALGPNNVFTDYQGVGVIQNNVMHVSNGIKDGQGKALDFFIELASTPQLTLEKNQIGIINDFEADFLSSRGDKFNFGGGGYMPLDNTVFTKE